MTADSVLPKIALGVALLGATAGVVGSFAVLRRRSLLGDTLAHAALPGICVAHLLFGTRDLLVLSLGALAAGLLGVFCVTLIQKGTRTRQDAALGLVLSTFFGAGVVLLTVIQRQATGAQAGLDSYLFGEVASLSTRDLGLIAAVGAVAVAGVGACYKELKVVCFDDGFAAAQGWPTFAIDLGMMAAIAVVTIISLPVCGVVLIAAILIFPCATARYWSDRLGVVLILSGVLGALSASGGVLSVGLAGSGAKELPPGPMIVLASAGVFVLSMLFAPRRGLVARMVQSLRLRIEVASDHLLRSLYEANEAELPAIAATDRGPIVSSLGADLLTRWLVVRGACARGWIVERPGDRMMLTTAGLHEAAEVTRAHRLWELFLVTHADIAADHVHRDADDLEHFLPAPLIASLEKQLARAGRLPGGQTSSAVPESLHEVEPATASGGSAP